jgi:hypothetical protein
MTICPEGAKLLHADARTDRQTNEASSRFSQFCEGTWKLYSVAPHSVYVTSLCPSNGDNLPSCCFRGTNCSDQGL